jgi:hypothetical protein
MRSLILIACLLPLAACHRKPSATGGQSAAATAARPATAEQDAQVLGREIYDLIDRAMSYRSSHRGRAPKSLRELGLDQLTPRTARSLTQHAGLPEARVAFRDTTGHRLAACRGTQIILEDATVRGSYTLTCDYVEGGTAAFTVLR